VGIGQPENTCQPTNIVDCFPHLSGDSPRVCSKKRKAPCPPIRNSFLGPKRLIGCSTSAKSSDWLGSSKPNKEKKERGHYQFSINTLLSMPTGTVSYDPVPNGFLFDLSMTYDCAPFPRTWGQNDVKQDRFQQMF